MFKTSFCNQGFDTKDIYQAYAFVQEIRSSSYLVSEKLDFDSNIKTT